MGGNVAIYPIFSFGNRYFYAILLFPPPLAPSARAHNESKSPNCVRVLGTIAPHFGLRLENALRAFPFAPKYAAQQQLERSIIIYPK